MSRFRSALLLLILIPVLASGCAALVDAGFRELQDDGKHPRYEHQGYWEHFVDSLFEDDDDDC